MRKLVLPLLFPVLLLVSAGCTSYAGEAEQLERAPRYPLYLYATNRSKIDSLALVEIAIDDSVFLNEHIAYSDLSSSNLVDSTTIARGQHRVKVAFGRFRLDTVVTISHPTSLVTSMNYERHYPTNNGLALSTVIRDGSGGRD